MGISSPPVDSDLVVKVLSEQERITLLRKLPGLHALPLEARQIIAGLMHEERYAPDATIVREGESGEALYLVVEGCVEVTSVRDGRPVTLATLDKGSLFGENALLSKDHHHEASVTAVTPVLLLALTDEDLDKVAERYPKAREVLRHHSRLGGMAKVLASHLIYAVHFQDIRRELLFLSSISFFLAFVMVRLIVTSIRAGIGPFHNVATGGTHIHHLVWGIVLLLLVGYLWLLQMNVLMKGTDRRRWLRLTAILYGIGAALTLDEFALWLKLADVYFTPEGQKSIQAVFLFGSLLFVGVWGGAFFRGMYHFLFRKHPVKVRV
jgi:CRP-like cAMP-binding protein